MNTEQIEHELNNRCGSFVSVVRPGYGKQSDSWVGYLSVTRRDFPMIFQVISTKGATIFGSDDVSDLEKKNEPELQEGRVGDCEVLIIRLKGPFDYKEHFVNA